MQRCSTILCINSHELEHVHKQYFEKAQEFKVIHGDNSSTFGFSHEEGFRPISGDMLKFYQNSQITSELYVDDYIEIKNYTWDELLKAFPSSSSISLFYNECMSGEDLFDTQENIMVTDYPTTITLLENKGIIETKLSSNWMSTDGRCFRIIDDNDDLFDCDIESEELYNTWWEVDILGTSHGINITDKIINVFYKNCV